MKIYGNITALITPFANNGKVDYEALKRLIMYQLKHNSDGIVLFGSTGEGHLLSESEKIKILKIAKKLISNKIPIIVSILSTTTYDCALEISKREKQGADAFLIAPPGYIKPSQESLYNHFYNLSKSTKLPIILYNIPSRVGVNIEFETLKRLSKLKNIIGIKDADTNFERILHKFTLQNKNFAFFAGNDNFILPMLALGAKGAISVIGNIYPETIHDIFEVFEYDPSLAKNLYLRIEKIISAMGQEVNPLPIKYLMSKIFKTENVLRNPLSPLSDVKGQKLDKVLNKQK